MAAQTGLALRLAYTGYVSNRNFVRADPARNHHRRFLMTFIVPSGVSRVVILAAICIGIVDAFGASEGNVSRGLFIIFLHGHDLRQDADCGGGLDPGAWLDQARRRRPVYYSQWFLAYLPCDLITVACWAAVLWLYPPEKKGTGGRAVIHPDAAFETRPDYGGRETSRVADAGDHRALDDRLHHHIPASMIGLGAGLVACLPVIGVLNSEQFKKIDPLPVMLTAAVLSMAVVLTSTKAIEVVNAAFFSRVQPLLHSVNYSSLVLYWAGFVYHFFLPEPSNLSTSMPLLMRFAKENNLSPSRSE
jgi:hypothetical protein